MGKVRVKIPPFLASLLNTRGSDWLVIERGIAEGTTIVDLLTDLASSYNNFRRVVFNPDVGRVSDQVIVILNDEVLQPQELAKARLNDGDSIVLLPVYSGG